MCPLVSRSERSVSSRAQASGVPGLVEKSRLFSGSGWRSVLRIRLRRRSARGIRVFPRVGGSVAAAQQSLDALLGHVRRRRGGDEVAHDVDEALWIVVEREV